MTKKDGIGYNIHCDICNRKLGGFYGLENEQESRSLYQVSKIYGKDFCWKCNIVDTGIMTKGKLIKELESYADDIEIKIYNAKFDIYEEAMLEIVTCSRHTDGKPFIALI